MNVGGWRPDLVRDFDRAHLDAIDLAYAKHEFPMMVVSGASGNERELVQLLKQIGNSGVVVPGHFTIDFLGPLCAQHPLELARWADDGGRV